MRIVYFDICALVLSITVLVFLLVKHYTKDRTNRLIIALAALIISASALDLFDSAFGAYIPQSSSNADIQLASNTLFYIILFIDAIILSKIIFFTISLILFIKFINIYCKSKNRERFKLLSFSSILISFFLNFIFISSLFRFCKLSIL